MLAETDAQGLVHRALSQLPENQRQLIALAFFRGLSHSEIAQAVSLPLGTVKTNIRRGIARLREILEESDGGLRS
jgi:RNA polymerase sigma-70 factor (ECF subfamily)